MKRLAMLLALLPGCPLLEDVDIDIDTNDKAEIALKIEEADTLVRLYEARLKTSQIQVKQDEADRDHKLDRAWKLYNLLQTRAVAEKEYLSAKLDYDLAVLEVEESKSAALEAEHDLALARVRRRMAEKGDESEHLKLDRIRIKRNRAR